ncbi:DUF4340 domain-containing protein [Gorillibacterium sp. sgz5001074]|uniref:DUF4340 domain-containing protein n=1 Tax=Gorillibacterium sp. sgz5001074 TaxID=3446695 RepID=UPI003F66B07C
MKKLLPTLLLVVVLIAGYVYAKQENFFREKAKPASVLFTLQSAEVTGVKLGTGDNAVEIKRKDDGWEMLKPAAYPVEKLAADGLAQSMADLKVKGVIDENPGSLADFGLDRPSREVEAALKDGSVRKLLVGSPLPVAGTTYVKAADRNTVYEMEDSVLSGVSKTAEDLLDKNVLKVEYDKIKSVELEWKGEKWTLTKSDLAKKAYESAWKLGDKELKPEEGGAILDKLTFLATDRLPKAKGEVNLAAAELKLTVKQEDGGQETVLSYAGKIDNELVRIAKDDGAWAYAVTVTDIQALYDMGKK